MRNVEPAAGPRTGPPASTAGRPQPGPRDEDEGPKARPAHGPAAPAGHWPQPEPLAARATFLPVQLESASRARAWAGLFLERGCRGNPVPDHGDVLLLVSEFVANAVKAMLEAAASGSSAGLPFVELSLRLFPGHLLIEVTDGSQGIPVTKPGQDPEAPGWRGLAVVGSLSETWGWNWRTGRSRKVVWCKVAVIPGEITGKEKMSVNDLAEPPSGFDVAGPATARACNAGLGGKGNDAPGRQVAGQVTRLAPGAGNIAARNRDFIRRAIRRVVLDGGIRQVAGTGAGLPAPAGGNTRQVPVRAHADRRGRTPAAAGTRVVRVDKDTLVPTRLRGTRESPPWAVDLRGGLARPQDIRTDPRLLGGWELVEPGVAGISGWRRCPAPGPAPGGRPRPAGPKAGPAAVLHGAAARKPAVQQARKAPS